MRTLGQALLIASLVALGAKSAAAVPRSTRSSTKTAPIKKQPSASINLTLKSLESYRTEDICLDQRWAGQSLKRAVSSFLFHRADLYNQAGRAAVVVATARSSLCVGVLVPSCGEVGILTGAHCVRKNGKNFSSIVGLTSFYKEPATPKDTETGRQAAWHSGYWQQIEKQYYFPAEAVQLDLEFDLAYVGGLTLSQLGPDRQPLQLAERSPPRGHPVMTLRWNWKSEALQSNFGFSLGVADEGGFDQYALEANPGDSGSMVVDVSGQLAGIVINTSRDKSQDISSGGVPPKIIRKLLQAACQAKQKPKGK